MKSLATLIVATAVALAAVSATAGAQEQATPIQPIEPDRPDVTNGAHLVEKGQLLFELGGIFTRDAAELRDTDLPLGVRFGVARWLELRASTDERIAGNEMERGISDVQVGAKIRLWPAAGGISRLSVIPAVNVPRSGEPSVGVTAATGFDIGSRAHLDVNYGLSAVGVEDGPHFVQHLVSGSFSVAASDRLSPFVEVFDFSRVEADGTAVVAINTGLLYALTPLIIVDGGVQFGTSVDAPSFAVFGGVSFAVRRRRPRPTSTSVVRGRD